MQVGGFKKYDYGEHFRGIYQGDILSPLLSNIYLDVMDTYIESKEIPFVRYADDCVPRKLVITINLEGLQDSYVA